MKNLIRVFTITSVRALLCIIVSICANFSCFAQEPADETRIANLKSAIRQVLQQTLAPGASVAIVTKNGPLMICGFGKADIEKDVSATDNTLFRIASISKMFVALSILKLQEEGKLDLQDKVRDHVPEIEFDNPWEETDPVRIVHLLEHTTGWDDYHLVEQTTVPLTLKEGLDFHPHSRCSRWVPGSRMAYSNSGAGVAAFIVEKIAGKSYEDYVEENFFRPLNMEHTTFFDDTIHRQWGATLYDTRFQPLPYRHVIQRPAGSIHSSARDMAAFVQLFLNRGTTASITLLHAGSIARMEVSRSTPGAKAGLELGYGLANFTSIHKGFLYQGHNGGMPGALSELAYLPEHGIGHVIFLNIMNPNTLSQISDLVRDFETASLPAQERPIAAKDSVVFSFRDGYYLPINPRMQGGYFADRLLDVYKFVRKDKAIVQSWILPGSSTTFYPASDSTFRLGSSDKVGMAKAVDPLEGEVLYTDSRVYAYLPTFVVFSQIGIFLSWIMMMGLGTLIFIITLAGSWAGKGRAAFSVTIYPAMATLLFFSSFAALLFSQQHHSHLLAAPGPLSITLLALSVWFILSVGVSTVRVVRNRGRRIPPFVYWSSAILTCLHLIVTIYLLWFRVVPVITWA